MLPNVVEYTLAMYVITLVYVVICRTSCYVLYLLRQRSTFSQLAREARWKDTQNMKDTLEITINGFIKT